MTRQVVGSLVAAAVIVVVTIVVVTARLGTTSTAELELREDALKERTELREERLDQQRELREERQEQREGRDSSGPG